MTNEKKKMATQEVRKELEKARKVWGWSHSDIISMLRGGGSSSKGGAYERDICRTLSRWWTGGTRDDIYWRSAASGARAKVRGRAGAGTLGQHGDIAATDPIGFPLIDVFTIELKRGYSEHTFQDLIDRKPTAATQEWERFLLQTVESYEQAGSYTWLLITRRDQRMDLVWHPAHVVGDLREVGAFAILPCNIVRIRTTLRYNNSILPVYVCGMTLQDWLGAVTPEQVRQLSKGV